MKLALFSLFLGCASAFVAQPATTFLSTQVTVGSVDRPSFQPLYVASLDTPTTVGTDSQYFDSPEALISDLLVGLLLDPDTNHRMKRLLHSSTHNWRSKIYDAIGAPASADEDQVAASLAAAMRNADNQFALLLGMAEDYEFSFPSDAVDHHDGKCWIECRLHNKKDGKLLVVSGWELQKNFMNGSWMLDRIDWQDFRDAFYPGLGREEWCRAFV